MGTRCDFYVGRDSSAEWLGSVAWNGDPENFPEIIEANQESRYREEVTKELEARDDATLPEAGWPWPWEDSRTTDYAITFDDGEVYASCFGHSWYRPGKEEEPEAEGEKVAVFPNMKSRQKVTFGARSGLMVFVSKEGK